MKAIALTQPWATLVALGAKRLETRSWDTTYRGPLAIHAAKGFPRWAREFARTDAWVQEILLNAKLVFPEFFPVGAVLCIVNLTGTCHTEGIWNIPEHERAFGDYGPGRYAWQLTDLQVLAKPYPCSGKLGLWNVEIPSEYEVSHEA